MQYNHKKETEIYVKKVFICKMTKNMRGGVRLFSIWYNYFDSVFISTPVI